MRRFALLRSTLGREEQERVPIWIHNDKFVALPRRLRDIAMPVRSRSIGPGQSARVRENRGESARLAVNLAAKLVIHNPPSQFR